MTSKRHLIFFKYFTYAALLILLYVLQTTPRLFEIAETKPNLLIPAAICIAMYEGEFTGGILGALAGLLCDLGSFTIFGFNGILVMAGCVAAGLLTFYLIQLKLINALFLGAGVLLLRGLIEYFFYFQMWGYEGAWRVLVFSTLPIVAYSTLAIVPMFFLVRKLKLFYDSRIRP